MGVWIFAHASSKECVDAAVVVVIVLLLKFCELARMLIVFNFFVVNMQPTHPL
jgi:hypothetical protein